MNNNSIGGVMEKEGGKQDEDWIGVKAGGISCPRSWSARIKKFRLPAHFKGSLQFR